MSSFVLPPTREVPARLPVPAGRIGYDLRDDDLLLHTFVPPAAIAALTGGGRLVAGDEHVDPLEPLAYQWMRTQVRTRLGADVWPIWAWAKVSRRDLVDEAVRRARSEDTYLLTCRVPRTRVLLSHFQEWHNALNGAPLVPAGLDDGGIDAFYDDWYDHLDAACPLWAQTSHLDWPSAVRDELATSWQGLFDVSAYPRRDAWQACLTYVDVTDVVDVAHLHR